jgi:hypothetical protein
MAMKAEIMVNLDKKLSLNYNSVGVSASLKIVKEVDSTDQLSEELTTLKVFLEGWIDQQVVLSAQGLPRLAKNAKAAADDIPL